MDIGVCLPTTIPGADGSQLIEFARRADRLGFHSLTVVDRVVYDNYDGIVALSAAAAVTERIKLVTAILLAAYRPSAVELAKQLASLDRLSGGRLILGVSAGMRQDDYVATGADYGTRGRRLDAMIEEIREVWKGEGPVPGVGPRPTNGDIPIWAGGHSPAGLRRAAKYGIGWISPGGPPHKYPELVTKIKELWAEEGRTGSPRMGANCYVSLGPDGKEQATEHMLSYYSYMGTMAQHLAAGAVTDEGRLRDVVDGYAANGCDELLLLSCTADPDHLDRIADVVLR
ncbi:LLM class flavin-dependent oxidoreductase [Streptosporangium roseum]|uniref:Coenzyme F420-dependent N5 N10-methylene tetrahydromethanopterin reductase-like protein n=1 Tax=Streptosporangium roseum (strain ATCC 12428 / DSM 43021 / JCM 3005 / KCTC 9067 / NCIMB 10171 / NRRL 2505 / NI 9100) TaxID=479432 RepID=D2AY57_STRRD|nr:LLM class flavin-dependent oxidoreductase [Streptosporangium roseum]ACZ87067.1 Coenzyme F420-dependent N5 N10-methylene tetrahydromethanopterin reductase-like protein [Streptosporangium roseum DSM 43021]